ncbi:MAG: phosphatidate cytidylyltransferase [Candidatus Hydrogenedentes bacterium]|nr:phosphatidate cytidylyltransferase [Candidatus Hydrogenedentota bacterium]
MTFPRLEGTALRLATALIWLPAVTAIVWLPSLRWAFVLLVLFLSFVGACEFFAMARKLDMDARGFLVTLLAPLLAAGSAIADLRMLLAICLLLIMAAHLLSARKDIAGLSVSILGLMYAGYLPAYFTALHQTPVSGPAMITLLLAVIGISDTGAYLIGKRLGKHKLAPKISPNKTVEGAIAALFSAAAAAAVLYALKEALHWESYPDWPLALYILVAILLSVVGQLGDLTESTLKRSAGVKDSGTLFPGHGGALDRCDAFLFGAPALYYLAFYIG